MTGEEAVVDDEEYEVGDAKDEIKLMAKAYLSFQYATNPVFINNFVSCFLHIDRMITYVQYLYVLNAYVQLSYTGYRRPM